MSEDAAELARFQRALERKKVGPRIENVHPSLVHQADARQGWNYLYEEIRCGGHVRAVSGTRGAWRLLGHFRSLLVATVCRQSLLRIPASTSSRSTVRCWSEKNRRKSPSSPLLHARLMSNSHKQLVVGPRQSAVPAQARARSVARPLMTSFAPRATRCGSDARLAQFTDALCQSSWNSFASGGHAADPIADKVRCQLA